MLKEVDRKVWEEEIASQKTSIFDEPDYLSTVSSLYNTIVKYWIVYKKDKAVIGFATHIKNNSVIVPNHYSYSSFWFDEQVISGFSFYEYLEKGLSILKEKYKYISFRLPPHIKDIRAFNFHGFTSKVAYTYIKQTNEELVYRNDVKVKLKKAQQQGFEFSYNKYYEDVLRQQLEDFPYFGYSKAQTTFYRYYFDILIKKGFLKSFAVHQNKKLIASALILVDVKHKKGYNLLISASKTNYSGDASTFLYHQIFLHLKESNILFSDLYGADMKGIANYKAGFKGDLENHYIVNLGFSERFVTTTILKLKKTIKSFFR